MAGLLLVPLAAAGTLAQARGAELAADGPTQGQVAAAASPAATPAVQPTPQPDPALGAGDPRSEGQAPGLVGEPLLVLVGIVLVGVATVVGTVIIARLTGRA